MHVGSYDMEPLTIGKMKAQVAQEGLSIAIDDKRMHHEIYLSDPRKTAVDKLKTVIRLSRKIEGRCRAGQTDQIEQQ